MEIEKFKKEISALKKFFEIYCKKKHQNQELSTNKLIYKEEAIEINLHLCKDCLKKINYSFDKLKICPHEEKPRCRKCPNPCYEKKQWKDIAQIMRYSAISLGLSKLNKKFKNLF